jgi:CBS domain containing-hemolysin-like protein
MVLVYLLVMVLLLLLNGFFVLAEFASVRVRGTQVQVLEEQNQRGGALLSHVHEHLDEYLSVCQLGITLASIGLGFVGEPAAARLIEPLMGSTAGAHAAAITLSYVAVSFLHILLSELLPKSVAIRFPERSALFTAAPLIWSRRLLYLPLVVMNGSANLILRLLGIAALPRETAASEAEVRVILAESQQHGVMSFRRLLLLENVFDFGHVRVRDDMRPMDQVHALHADRPWNENRDTILRWRHTRYPLVEGDPPRLLGIVHFKDLLYHPAPWPNAVNLREIARKAHITTLETPLEQLLSELLRIRAHMALVQDQAGCLAGAITLEDILEQLVGSIEDEFEQEAPLRLADALKESRVFVDLKANTATQAIEEILQRADPNDLPQSAAQVAAAVIARERSFSTYLGGGLGVPHTRLDSLKAPCLFVARSTEGVVFDPRKPREKAQIIFLLLTPTAAPRMQLRLLARIASLRESAYVWDRMLMVATPAEMLEAVRTGEELRVE